MEHFEAIIIGGGSAGLAASVALARSRRSVLVIDEGHPRNEPAEHAHNVLGQEGTSPLKLLERGRVEAQNYGARITAGTVDSLSGSLDEGFMVHAGNQVFSAERIVLATGLKDELPRIPGLQQAWGTSAIHCAYCHGWEVRDQEILVIGCGPMSAHQAMMFQQLSSKITFINHAPSELSEEGAALLADLGIPVVNHAIQDLEFGQSGQLKAAKLDNGERLQAQSLIVASRMNANADLYLSLGGELSEHPLGTFIKANETCATEVPGVYAVGNASNLGAMVMAAAASGTLAGAAINADLLNSKLVKP
ncbi:NAD(P)/FAD-dependent oxidoreductase [Glutamicibacter halophytocola]|uniref:NAD(P)/FAD-dependent oxidoreductase n=1 Tax=Glutamicibacter halophytocola TaxID=1933880 RepID=UPI001558819A|nr:NAD(P)/FAD-dependent oxidoreductase [Glutamicibacter halophytocola]NQD40860.1 NAD(P)/FAD-dependent oxidoreductase [Glutamicibacter halophytocola]